MKIVFERPSGVSTLFQVYESEHAEKALRRVARFLCLKGDREGSAGKVWKTQIFVGYNVLFSAETNAKTRRLIARFLRHLESFLDVERMIAEAKGVLCDGTLNDGYCAFVRSYLSPDRAESYFAAYAAWAFADEFLGWVPWVHGVKSKPYVRWFNENGYAIERRIEEGD